MNQIIESLMQGFQIQAKESKKFLETVLELISEGYAPKNDMVQELTHSMDQLREKYNAVYQLAKKELSDEEMPDEGRPVSEYAEALENSRAMQYKKLLEETKALLEKFISVQSLMEIYAQALQPYQEQALALVKELNEDCALEAEVLENQTKGPKLFLEALETDDLDSEKGCSLIDELGKEYTTKVGIGISRGKYFLPKEKDTPDQKKTTKEPVSAEEKKAEVPPAPNCSESVASKEETEEKAEIPNESECVKEPVPEAETEAEKEVVSESNAEAEEKEVIPENESAFAKIVREKGVLLPKEDCKEPVLTECAKTQGKKNTFNTFKNDLQKTDFSLSMDIVKYTLEHGAATKGLLYLHLHAEQELMDRAIEQLVRKGYFIKYHIDSLGEYYIPAAKLKRVLLLGDGKILAKNIRNSPVKYDLMGNKFSSAAMFLSYLNAVRDSAAYFKKNLLPGFTNSTAMSESAFILDMTESSDVQKEVFIGAFWENTEDCDKFYEFIDEKIDDLLSAQSIVFAGLTAEKAKVFGEAVLDSVAPDVKNRRLYLYGLREDAYFTYETMEQVCAEQTEQKKETEEAVPKEREAFEEEQTAAEETENTAETEIIETAEAESVSEEEIPEEKQIFAEEPASEEKSDVIPKAVEESIPEIEEAPEERTVSAEEQKIIPEENETIEAESVSEEEIPEEKQISAEEPASEEKSDVIPKAVEESIPEIEEAPEEKTVSAEGQQTISEEIETAEAESASEEEFPAVEEEEEKYTFNEAEKQSHMENIYHFLAEENYYAASAYVRACAHSDSTFSEFSTRLAYALNDPMEKCIYTSANAFNKFSDSDNDSFQDAMNVASAIRTFFTNHIQYDYGVNSLYDSIKSSELLSRFSDLSSAVTYMKEFKNTCHKGLDAFADYRTKDKQLLENKITSIQKEAASFYENNVIGKKREHVQHARFLETKKILFSQTSDIGIFLKAAADGNTEYTELAEEFLSEYFFDKEAVISEDTINKDMLWDYIKEAWNDAGNTMFCLRSSDLMGSLRNNITNETMKAIQILAGWVVLQSRMSELTEDIGADEYKIHREKFLKSIQASVEQIEAESKTVSERECAGLHIILRALREIEACIDGTMDEKKNEYYYVPFLLTQNIMLDDSFFPQLDVFRADAEELRPCRRIIEHIRELKEHRPSYKDRLKSILEDGGDDYGTAKQIVSYLKAQKKEEDFSTEEENIRNNIAYAERNAEVWKEDFVGELELAKCNGQLINSNQDIILHIVDRWYRWAEETKNFGFFKKVLDTFLFRIREDAKDREVQLLAYLEAFENNSDNEFSVEAKKKRVEKIKQMIREQNYTVAEDLLRNDADSDEEYIDLSEKDYLKDFIKEYDICYTKVSGMNKSLEAQIKNTAKNKEQRGGQKLVQNWLPGGGRLGEEKLFVLLHSLGFSPDKNKIVKTDIIDKYENYMVYAEADRNNHRSNFAHPIAAFGSSAVQEGFRVVCMHGRYDADNLIEVMKKIGDEKHTLILLDYALELSQRRRLARKVKRELGEKAFAVIDRTVMMYLVRNYDVTKINKMLMSIIMPFSNYQPYIWKSSNVMPPEIFIGRKTELEKIKSASGVNIVYGGRQLGKSALLKRAKELVDHNANNDRAVYIDIKGLNYEKTAQKIADELYDQNILEERPETTDWDMLARAIKNRLKKEDKDKIPYLLLLLDEADAFIESCESVNYHPFDALKEIQGIGQGRFKFVVAGLVNIVRFKRDAALGKNSVLTHLGAMTVKPFNGTEGMELIKLPLHYLGVRFPERSETLISLILATSNYFPGLIQMYCAKLLEAMREKDYAGFNETDTPVYEIKKEQIKKILSDKDFNEQIKDKFEITLRCEEDNYYYLLALIMAYLYYEKDDNYHGYTVHDIAEEAKKLGIIKLERLKTEQISALMEELCDLNVFTSLAHKDNSETTYLFCRFTFFQMMGSHDQIETKLLEMMEEDMEKDV